MTEEIATEFQPSILDNLKRMTALPSSNPRSYMTKLENVRSLLAEGQGLYPEISVATTQAYYDWMVERLATAIRRDGKAMKSRYSGTDATTGDEFEAGTDIIWAPGLRLAMRANG